VLRQLRGSRVDRAVEVVGDDEDLADEVLPGQPEVALALLGGSPAEVAELGSLALEQADVLLALAARVGELALQLLDLREELRRRDVELVDPLLCAGAIGHRISSLGG
jgi:hypothetical protein